MVLAATEAVIFLHGLPMTAVAQPVQIARVITATGIACNAVIQVKPLSPRASAARPGCRRLLKEFEGRGSLLRALYYTAISEEQEYPSLRPLTDWLSYNGYTVVTKVVKEFTGARGRRKVKGNMDVELAVDAMELAGEIDQMFYGS
jgi:hypothetical protein